MPDAASECDPSRDHHWTALRFESYRPTQSPGAPGPFATIAVTVPPTVPVPESSVTVGVAVGGDVVIVPLVATSTYDALKSLAWNVPGVAGRANVTVALVTPVAGSVCDPFKYCHWIALPPASKSPTQSAALPGPFATVAVTAPPAAAVDAPSVTVGTVVVIVPLVATSVYDPLNSRAWNVPGVDGSRNATVAFATPAAGIVCVPFRYAHCSALPLGSYRPTQSPGVPGAFVTLTFTVPPALAVDAPRATLGMLAVTVPLVATSVYAELNRRT